MAKKLIEALVVEGQLKSQAQTLRAQVHDTFAKKRHLFEQKRLTFIAATEGAEPVVEEQSDIQSDIMKELRWLGGIWTKALDTSMLVAEGNTKARASVVLDDGTVLLENVPGTALLELEKRASEIQELISSAPTLDPAKGFKPDPDTGPRIFVAREVLKDRTKKDAKVIELTKATPEHAATAQLVPYDKVVGQTRQQEWSGLITPAHKSEMLERTEELRRAVKAALHRANAVEVGDSLPICGKKIFDFVLGRE